MIKDKEKLGEEEYQKAIFGDDISNCRSFSGYLSRRNTKGFWQKRFFYLNNEYLIYKKDALTLEIKGVLSLHDMSAVKAKGNELEVVMNDGTAKLFLRGNSENVIKEWENHIYERIAWCNLQAEKVVKSADMIRESQLFAHASGDILEVDGADVRGSLDSFVNQLQLSVKLIKAKNLVACTKNGRSNPFIVMTLLNSKGNEDVDETAVSDCCYDTVNPEWNQDFVFGENAAISILYQDVISFQLEIFHKSKTLIATDMPMGRVIIPFSARHLHGKEIHEWFNVEKCGRMLAASGSVELQLKWEKIHPKENEANDNLHEDKRDKDDEELSRSMASLETSEKFLENDPNELVVTVFKCQNLRWVKKKKVLPDPVIILKVNEAKKQWKVASKTLNPVWNDTYFFKVTDPSMSLTVTIEYKELVRNSFVGQIVIPLRPLQNKKVLRQWFKLRNVHGHVSSVDLGNIELALLWRYNPDAVVTVSKGLKFLRGLRIGRDSDTDISDENESENETEYHEPSTADKEIAVKEKAKVDAALEAEISKMRLKSGNYQILIHIIEVRELAAKNLNGLSDPVVFVEVRGEKQKSSTRKDCLSAVFDELFIFNLKNMEKEELERVIIEIRVYDANVLSKSVLIGSYSIDLEAVYFSKDHEKYRQWVGLTNHEDPSATSFQGFLKFSAQVVGENESVKVHNEQEENRKEEALVIKNGCPLVNVLAPPYIVKEWVFIVVAVYEADYLPVMDRSMLNFKKDGTDAYAELQFSSNPPVRTRIRTLKGNSREAMNPIFNYELWVPVSLPSASQHISFSMWDHDVGSPNDLIGTYYSSLKRLLLLPRDPLTGLERSTGLIWANLYGSHKSTSDEVLETVKKSVKSVHRSAVTGDDKDYEDYYNRSPGSAPAYNGRVLISQRVASPKERPKKHMSESMEPFMRSIRKVDQSALPTVQSYKLKAILVRGSDLPSYAQVKGLKAGDSAPQKLQVVVSVGKYEIISKQANCAGRSCVWGELLESGDISLPEDLSQVPDIFVYLMTAVNETGANRLPICFKRIPVKDLVDKKFSSPCEWIMLQKDMDVSGISLTERPGHLLMKLGFGTSDTEKHSKLEWDSILFRLKQRTPYEVRVHLYQGKDFPATDDNGLSDPYIKLNLMGEVQQSSVKRKTRFPLFYETLSFDCLLPDKEFLPLLDCVVYDKDILFDEYVGQFCFSLKKGFQLKSNQEAFPDPEYYQLFVEKPGDGQGEVLLSVQLIDKTLEPVPPPLPSLVPHTRSAFIEVTALGLRKMHPYNFQKMVSPYVEICIQSMSGKHVVGTEPSKFPSSSNPNFLEQFTVEVQLPRNALYAVPLMLIAKDVRMGGLLRPEVGVAYIDIVDKIPWAKSYVPPQSDMYIQDGLDMKGGFSASSSTEAYASELDNVGKAVLAIQKQNDEDTKDDNFIVTSRPLDVIGYIKKRIEEVDTGVGVFGALSHLALPEYGGHRKRTAEDYFVDIDWDESDSDDEDSPPKYMEGRSVLNEELEKKLKNSPFETYSLARGNKTGKFPSFKSNVGVFKGLIRVYVDADNPPLVDLNQLRTPQTYICRLYVLRGLNLTPMDPGFGGRPGKSDPYLKVKLDTVILDDRENAVDDVTDVDFYKMVEFGCELPGTSQLQVQVYDHDVIGSDDLIGETVIDLEDRWFDRKWQQIGEQNRVEPASVANTPPRWHTKDLERRTLYAPTSNSSQGILECWLDIMTPSDATVFEPDAVALPPREIFEVRLVIWKCKDVPAADTFGGQNMTDMYLKCWVEGCSAQETDTHWRAKKGKGSFNWRMKFDVELGHNTRAMKFPYLHIQLWDRDLLKWNDCMAESTVSLGAYFRKAFRKHVAIKLFEKPKGAMSKRKKMTQKKSSARREDQAVHSGDADVPPSEELVENPVNEFEKPSGSLYASDSVTPEPESPPKKSIFPFSRKRTANEEYIQASREEEDNREEEEKPLLSQSSGDTDENDFREDIEFINQIKSMTGFWDVDPEDSTWLFLDRLDQESGVREPMGKVCYG